MKKLLVFDPGAFIFSLVASVSMFVAGAAMVGYYHYGYPVDVFGWITPLYGAVLVFLFALCMVLLYFLSVLVYKKIESSVEANTKKDTGTDANDEKCTSNLGSGFPSVWLLPKVDRVRFVKYFLILIACWAFWVIAHLPGAIDHDTVWQLMIWRTPVEWYDHHPWLSTMIFGSFMDFGRFAGSQAIGLVVYSVIQTLVTASLFAYCFSYAVKLGVPKVLANIVFAIVCLIPAYPSYASEMAKEPLFCIVWIPIVLIYIEALRTKCANLDSFSKCLVFSLLLIFGALVKKVGIFIFIPMLVVLFVIGGKRSSLKLVFSTAVFLLVFFTWNTFALPAMGVDKGPSKEMLSLPLQQSARVVAVHGDELDRAQRDAIDGVLPLQDLPDLYFFITADPVKDSYKDSDIVPLFDYFGSWFVTGFQYSGTYAMATVGTNMKILVPATVYDIQDDISDEWVQENVEVFGGYVLGDYNTEERMDRDSSVAEGLASFEELGMFEKIPNGYKKILDMTPLRLFDSPSFAVFLVPLFMLCYVFGRKSCLQKSRYVFALVPSALVMASIVVGPMVLGRYCLCAADILPIIVFLPWLFSFRSVAKSSEKASS